MDKAIQHPQPITLPRSNMGPRIMPKENVVSGEFVRSDQGDLDGEEYGADVSPFVLNALGDALKAHFKAIAETPLPDRFMVLLAELEAREQRNDA